MRWGTAVPASWRSRRSRRRARRSGSRASRSPHSGTAAGAVRSGQGVAEPDDALATIDCSVQSVADGGDHWIVVGRVQVRGRAPPGTAAALRSRQLREHHTGPAAVRAVAGRSRTFLTTRTFGSWL
ncbi:flavin reductase family protein [Nocardia gamkensis]|uniref:flavin reductase family protein n=1 Tax=Nocardia gamkensis TaxID=352869 RepID=UPI0036ED86BA